MKYLAVVGLLVLGSLLVVGKDKFATQKYESMLTEQTLIQTERAWNEALIANDLATVNRILADEWTGIDFRGMAATKEETLAELKGGESRNEFVELGDMNVRLYGDTAVVMGTDTEKSVYQGQNSSGQYAFIDVFVKRDGRWQAVASQSTKIALTWLNLPIPTN